MLETLIKYKFLAIAILAGIFLSYNLVEENDSGQMLVIQSLSGEMRVVRDAGPCWQGWGKVTAYNNSNQYVFNVKPDSDGRTSGILTRFNDGGHGTVSGSMRWYMPKNDDAVIALHKDYRGPSAIETQLIAPTLTNAVFMSGPLLSSQESNASKKE